MNLPESIGGYQHLAPDIVCKPDDIYVQEGRPVGLVGISAGATVENLERLTCARIYRRIPVAKQSDAHTGSGAHAVAPQHAGNIDSRNAEILHAAARKATPVYSGFLKYFPLACAEVARVSKAGNDQHNPGKPLHWDRSKSGDELDALARHLLEAGTFDTDGVRHSAKLAWRSMANLEKELERAAK